MHTSILEERKEISQRRHNTSNDIGDADINWK